MRKHLKIHSGKSDTRVEEGECQSSRQCRRKSGPQRRVCDKNSELGQCRKPHGCIAVFHFWKAARTMPCVRERRILFYVEHDRLETNMAPLGMAVSFIWLLIFQND